MLGSPQKSLFGYLWLTQNVTLPWQLTSLCKRCFWICSWQRALLYSSSCVCSPGIFFWASNFSCSFTHVAQFNSKSKTLDAYSSFNMELHSLVDEILDRKKEDLPWWSESHQGSKFIWNKFWRVARKTWFKQVQVHFLLKQRFSYFYLFIGLFRTKKSICMQFYRKWFCF